MKVAIDAGPLYGHRTGVGVATAGMFDALSASGEVELAPYLVSGRATPQPGHRRLPMPGIVASQVWSRCDHPRADRWFGEVDVVHGTNYVAPPSSRPTVISVYDCWFLRHPDVAAPVVRRAGEQLRRRVADGAWIHASSTATAEQVTSLLGTERVAVIHLGAPPPPSSEPGATPLGLDTLTEHPFVVAIGTEERRKGLPLLVDAFAEPTMAHTDAHLVLAGARGDDSDAVDARLTEHPALDRIQRLGPIDDTTKSWLLRHATALAYPSVDEGFGFPILEAQRYGVPVVATDVGSIGEIAGDAAVLVPDREPAAFATALGLAMTGAERSRLIEAGARNVDRFRWDTTATEMIDLYRRACDT